MRSNKIGTLVSLPVCLLVLSSVSVWATPLGGLQAPQAQQQQRPAAPQPAPNEMPNQATPDQPGKDQASSATFTGTIVKDGEQFLLKDSTGTVYKLDDSSRASTFEGKSVKVTGKLDTDAKLIHVEAIEAVSA